MWESQILVGDEWQVVPCGLLCWYAARLRGRNLRAMGHAVRFLNWQTDEIRYG